MFQRSTSVCAHSCVHDIYVMYVYIIKHTLVKNMNMYRQTLVLLYTLLVHTYHVPAHYREVVFGTDLCDIK